MMMMMFKNKRLALTRTEDEEQKPKKHGCFACLTVFSALSPFSCFTCFLRRFLSLSAVLCRSSQRPPLFLLSLALWFEITKMLIAV